MVTDWMGRYRPLIKALVLHSNMAGRAEQFKRELVPGVKLSPSQWQVFECVLEHEGERQNMIQLSNGLGMAQSTFSKTVKKLCQMGLVDRYQRVGDRKSVILRGAPGAKEAYLALVEKEVRPSFEPFFSALDSLSDDDIAAFAAALERYNRYNCDEEEELVPFSPDDH